jgi:hypothetical protein
MHLLNFTLSLSLLQLSSLVKSCHSDGKCRSIPTDTYLSIPFEHAIIHTFSPLLTLDPASNRSIDSIYTSNPHIRLLLPTNPKYV